MSRGAHRSLERRRVRARVCPLAAGARGCWLPLSHHHLPPVPRWAGHSARLGRQPIGEWIRRDPGVHHLEHADWLALAGPKGDWDDIPGDVDPEHPAPFHIELPRQLIKLYSDRQDLVGDLWLGRGTTALACVELSRCFRGGGRSPTYVAIAQDRVVKAIECGRAA